VLTTPALSLLKQARPDLRITVVLAAPFAGLLDGNDDVTNELMQ
jgi:ADP-heptose:LPS heptosyltransferase